MKNMKLYNSSNMSTQKADSHVNNSLFNSCWSSTSVNAGVNLCPTDQFVLDDHKLLLDDHEIKMETLQCDSDEKSSIDVFDNLMLSSQTMSTDLSELKPLPPFTGYTGHLSINGISGHHYHAIAQRHNEENNNIYTTNLNSSSGFTNQNSADQNIVSSSTCLPDSALYPETTDNISTSCYQDVKLFTDNGNGGENKMCSAMADSCAMQIPCPDSMTNVRIYSESKELSEYVDMSSIEDIAAIIGSAIADTTVPNQNDERETNDSRDSWMDLDAWIDGNCVQSDNKMMATQQESIQEFILPDSPILTSSAGPPTSTLQNLLSNNYMPLLQSRLQNGPPGKNEAPSSTSYCHNDSITTTNSPPDSVVSTTDNVLPNGRCMSSVSSMGNHQSMGNYQLNITATAINPDGHCSPNMLSKYAHASSMAITSAQNTSKAKRRTSKNLKSSNCSNGNGGGSAVSSNGHLPSLANQMRSQNDTIGSSLNFQNASDLSDLLGKEKPVHRCNICNRGFLNKSNIKVHLRTHTGEKPFRCEVCSKAFRQKAHLIKHQQIHKRIGRD